MGAVALQVSGMKCLRQSLSSVAAVVLAVVMHPQSVAAYQEVSFIRRDVYQMKVETYAEPVVFQWGKVIEAGDATDLEAWAPVFELSDQRHLVDQGLSNELLLERWKERFVNGYLDANPRWAERFLKDAQTLSLEAYRAQFPQFALVGVYARISVREEGRGEWTFLLHEKAANRVNLNAAIRERREDTASSASAVLLFRNETDSSRFQLVSVRHQSVPDFVRHLSLRDLESMQAVVDAGLAHRPDDAPSVLPLDLNHLLKSLDPGGGGSG